MGRRADGWCGIRHAPTVTSIRAQQQWGAKKPFPPNCCSLSLFVRRRLPSLRRDRVFSTSSSGFVWVFFGEGRRQRPLASARSGRGGGKGGGEDFDANVRRVFFRSKELRNQRGRKWLFPEGVPLPPPLPHLNFPLIFRGRAHIGRQLGR